MYRSRIGTALAATMLAACFNLNPQPDPSRFYNLRAVSEAAPAAAGPTVGIGSIELPAYLDRAHLIERVDETEVRLLSADYWAGPLAGQIQRVLADEIRARSGLDRVERYPWRATDAPAWRVDVDIARFDTWADGVIELRATWEIRATDAGRSLLASGSDTWREQADGADVAQRVDAMSRALAGLARDIAAALR